MVLGWSLHGVEAAERRAREATAADGATKTENPDSPAGPATRKLAQQQRVREFLKAEIMELIRSGKEWRNRNAGTNPS